jgi:hypothetical protein
MNDSLFVGGIFLAPFICGTEKRPRREHHPGLVPRLVGVSLSVVDDNPAGVALVAGEGRARLMFAG